ncbi:hypothetical protein OG205_08385 [Lentzea sp. NBC_00516]|uniref:hypothetical protein n=1 Tax=Lentzea sp. NBC_00516 TaxID=2903582 RepID=UPI002E823E49|nr:hypothetical protein [Lentzea sp. NBC_00516]WUD26998.1 hypothetical protein OG205_08385 [Lentzea sp. NBC_00516]
MGPLQSTHAVPTDRRRVLGRVALIIAVVSAALLALSFVIDLDGAERGLIFAVIPLVPAVAAAVVLLLKAGPSEVIELYEDGIAHVFGGVRRSWAWDQVQAIDVAERVGYTEADCTVRFTDGNLLYFSGSTENSRVIIGVLTRHCVDAGREPLRARHKGRTAAFLGGVTLISGGVAAWGYLDGPTVFTVACAVPAVLSLILLISVLVTGRR